MKKCVLGDYILDMASGPFGSNLKVECFVLPVLMNEQVKVG